MAASDHLGRQFHEMTRNEFESLPGTWFHGTMTGMPGSGTGSFHVGSRGAATEALQARGGTKMAGQMVSSSMGGSYLASQPDVIGGRIVGSMTNTTRFSPRRGPARHKWEVREGVPRGAMEEWKRMDPAEPHSDVRANAVEGAARRSGRPLKQGFYYVNASEGAQEEHPISAVLPNRAHFMTHEDYLAKAQAAGQSIPKHVLKDYKHIPGQGRLI